MFISKIQWHVIYLTFLACTKVAIQQKLSFCMVVLHKRQKMPKLVLNWQALYNSITALS